MFFGLVALMRGRKAHVDRTRAFGVVQILAFVASITCHILAMLNLDWFLSFMGSAILLFTIAFVTAVRLAPLKVTKRFAEGNRLYWRGHFFYYSLLFYVQALVFAGVAFKFWQEERESNWGLVLATFNGIATATFYSFETLFIYVMF